MEIPAVDTGIDRHLVGLGIALAISFIIGLEREWAENKPVGVRSFALIGVLGGLSALLGAEVSTWAVAAGLVALATILAVHCHQRPSAGGVTTLVAALIVYLLGAAAVAGYWVHVLVVGGAILLLLHWKEPLHGWVERLGKKDIRTIVRFVLIALVILPVLPNRNLGPYDVFNPFTMWFLVVLIVGINLGGYIAFRIIGARAGGWLAGLIGGMVSSTATTFSYAGMSRRRDEFGPVAALVILVASIVVYGRVIVELTVVSPSLVKSMVGPAAAFSLVLLGLSMVIYRRFPGDLDTGMPERKNPAQLRLAIATAALYAVILLAIAAARDLVGQDAIYGVAFVSGLTDVDALTLSVGQLHGRGQIATDEAWRAIFLATLSNFAFKTAVASLVGSSSLRRWILGAGGASLAAGAALLVLWP